jgi:hypothetical protein
MKYLAAILLAATGASASEPKPEICWSYGLEAACRLGGKKDRLILLRQVHCACEEAGCVLLDRARQPAFLDRLSTKQLVEGYFVMAVAHAPKNGDVPGLHHPSFIPSDFRRDSSEIRTLIVTPTGHLIHRLDLCPHAAEADRELAFAQKIREECFTPTWAPVPGWEERLRALHAEHALKPEVWHKSLATAKAESPAAEMAQWTGYAKLDLVWRPDLEAAADVAKRTDRLVFYFQVVGNLDKEGC